MGIVIFFSSEDIVKLESHIIQLERKNSDLQYQNDSLLSENRILSKRYLMEMEYYLISSCVDKKIETAILIRKNNLKKNVFNL